MRLLILTTLLVSTALGGCVADATSKGGTDVAKQVDSNEQPEKIESPWKLGIESKRDAGPKIA